MMSAVRYLTATSDSEILSRTPPADQGSSRPLLIKKKNKYSVSKVWFYSDLQNIS